MMSSTVAGIDPHQDTFTVAVIDPNGVEIVHDTFDNHSCGYIAAIELLNTQGVERVGVEGSASWGSHVAVALAAPGFDAREVPPRHLANRVIRRMWKDEARRLNDSPTDAA